MMNVVFLFLVLISSCSSYEHPFDFIEDAMKNIVDWGSDPCEDFYRHACPIDPTLNDSLATSTFSEMVNELNKIQLHAIWRNEKLLLTHKSFPPKFLLSPLRIIAFFKSAVDDICESKHATLTSFVSKVENVFNILLEESSSRTQIEKLKMNCETSQESFDYIRNIYFSDFNANSTYLSLFAGRIATRVDTLISLHAHLKVDVLDGISQTSDMFDKILEYVYKLIEKTPWAMNHEVVKRIQMLANRMNMNQNLEKLTKQYNQILTKFAHSFESCLDEFQIVENAEKLCYIFTSVPLKRPSESLYMEDNARNWNNGLITFGFPYYYHNTYGKWLPAKLGFTGTVVGHEIGHTFIEFHNDPVQLGYFSNSSEKCIQGQFEKLCNVYAEVNVAKDGCVPPHDQFDDNGADIFGVQLAYKLFEDEIGNAIKDKVKGLEAYGVTNEQLFFYSYAFGYCQGTKSNMSLTHSADNLRVNSVAQLPGFQKAFHCSDDSRMMQAATDQCIIYGKNAPSSRKKFLPPL